MPYRRLPNTDKARIAALEKAVAMEHACDVEHQAASYKTLNEARALLRRFKSAVEQFQYCYTAQAEANRRYQEHLKTARLYISHFIQVLNLAVVRNEVRKEHKLFYGLDPDDFAVPDLTSEKHILVWGERLIEGERERLSHGGAPIYNPTIAKVSVHYDIFKDAYREQQNVMIAGEVLFSGNYALSKKNECLSDLIEKAGGVTPDAYVRGARLIRTMTEDEKRRREDVMRMANSGSGQDSISVSMLDQSDFYSVGINLEDALKKPGSDDDLVLRDGDILYVPEYVSTVKISGAVMYPNTVTYKKGENLKYYIDQAGGYGNNAKKRKAYVVYMNGTVALPRSSSSKAIEPGCEIIVPSKDKRNKMSPAEILSIGTSTASLATMIATLVNLFK